jgi:hypothetical protein
MKDNINKNKTIHGGQGVSKNSATPESSIGKNIGTEEEFGSSWYQEKTRGL